MKRRARQANKVEIYAQAKNTTYNFMSRTGENVSSLEQALVKAADIPEITENDVIITSVHTGCSSWVSAPLARLTAAPKGRSRRRRRLNSIFGRAHNEASAANDIGETIAMIGDNSDDHGQ